MLRYVCWCAMLMMLATGEMCPALAASPIKNSSPRSERARVRETPPTGAVAVTVMVAQSVRGVPEVPTQFYLAQNYPNPFNSTTVINYATPKTARVRLEIFNGLGQRVTTLVDEVQPSGYYSYPWGTDAMASGVYLYRMTAGPFMQTRRMILVK
jgi:hypothetical protein